VGYELYCQLLENAVRQLKQQPLRTHVEVTLDLPWPAFLPRDYVPGQRLRIEVYRRLARIRRVERLEDFQQELRDRYGAPPEPAQWLMRQAELRILAARWQIATIHLEEPGDKSVGIRDVVLGYRHEGKMHRLAQRSEGRLRIVDGSRAYFRVSPAETEPLPLYQALKHLLRLPERKL
jgi:transcription-repair coupling factor (superfamily II helicase)